MRRGLSAFGVVGRFTVGHVVAGLALICTSLIALVWSILRQVQNPYGERDRIVWPWLVIAMGSLSLIWGIVDVALGSVAGVVVEPGDDLHVGAGAAGRGW